MKYIVLIKNIDIIDDNHVHIIGTSLQNNETFNNIIEVWSLELLKQAKRLLDIGNKTIIMKLAKIDNEYSLENINFSNNNEEFYKQKLYIEKEA